jgi:hypothetical protein
MDTTKWKVEVERMRSLLGEPAGASDAKEIVDCLVRNYDSEVKGKSGKK